MEAGAAVVAAVLDEALVASDPNRALIFDQKPDDAAAGATTAATGAATGVIGALVVGNKVATAGTSTTGFFSRVPVGSATVAAVGMR